ncbi:hypothetical protein RAD16_32015 [Bradyrhizobium sp. 18BD]
MMSLKVLGAVVIAAAALSSSDALAQAALSNPDVCEAEFSTCTGLGSPTANYGAPGYRQSARRAAHRQAAAAPVGSWGAPGGSWGNANAMYGGYGGEYGWNGNWSQYAARNGIVCRPGTYYKGADGMRHLCQ